MPDDMPRQPGLSIHLPRWGVFSHMKGQTDPGVTLTINGERVQVQRNGSFSEHVVLKAGATALVIRATSLSGAVTEQRLPMVASR